LLIGAESRRIDNILAGPFEVGRRHSGEACAAVFAGDEILYEMTAVVRVKLAVLSGVRGVASGESGRR
jgi:hypothetical protein